MSIILVMNIIDFSDRFERVGRPAIAFAALAFGCVLVAGGVAREVAFAADQVDSPNRSAENSAEAVSGSRSGTETLEPLGGGDFSLRRRSTLELWLDRDRYRDAVL
ncbi:MAG: hypothetical protein ACF787_08985, partial [Rhodopirellula sp. JB053]